MANLPPIYPGRPPDMPPLPPSDAHAWAFQLTVSLMVIRNEDGIFAGKGPTSVDLTGLMLDASQIFCCKCSLPIHEGWGNPCEATNQY